MVLPWRRNSKTCPVCVCSRCSPPDSNIPSTTCGDPSKSIQTTSSVHGELFSNVRLFSALLGIAELARHSRGAQSGSSAARTRSGQKMRMLCWLRFGLIQHDQEIFQNNYSANFWLYRSAPIFIHNNVSPPIFASNSSSSNRVFEMSLDWVNTHSVKKSLYTVTISSRHHLILSTARKSSVMYSKRAGNAMITIQSLRVSRLTTNRISAKFRKRSLAKVGQAKNGRTPLSGRRA